MTINSIDIDKEGENKGEEIIAKGTPEAIAINKYSYTANFLNKELINN